MQVCNVILPTTDLDFAGYIPFSTSLEYSGTDRHPISLYQVISARKVVMYDCDVHARRFSRKSSMYNSGRLQYVGPSTKCSAFVYFSKDSIAKLHLEPRQWRSAKRDPSTASILREAAMYNSRECNTTCIRTDTVECELLRRNSEKA